MNAIVNQGDGLTSSWEADVVITDPVYDQQPDIDTLLKRCKGNVLVFCDPLHRPKKQPDEILFWNKSSSTKNVSKRCSRFVEEICVYRQGDTFNSDKAHWSIMTGIFNDTLIEAVCHPWQKPLSLLEKLLFIYSNPEDLVVDPFCGSGSCGVACIRQGRKFQGYEINPEYVDVCEKRGLTVKRLEIEK
jgi:hypothetical protein